jgi:hypothetical protein
LLLAGHGLVTSRGSRVDSGAHRFAFVAERGALFCLTAYNIIISKFLASKSSEEIELALQDLISLPSSISKS